MNENHDINNNSDALNEESKKKSVFDMFKSKKAEKGPKSALQEIMEWVLCIVVALVVAFVLKTYVVTIAEVDGDSMLNTLHHKERLITWKLGYKPEQNDIVIFQPKQSTPERRIYYVKRVIATEHQTIEINYNENAVYVDGVKIDEPYIYNNPAIDDDEEDFMEVRGLSALTNNPDDENNALVNNVIKAVVPEGHVYVMGDNRNNSSDSRTIGFVPVSDIEGKVVFRLWPLDKIGTVK